MNTILKTTIIETPLGQMLAVADEKFLYLLDFLSSKNIQSNIEKLKKITNSTLIDGLNNPLNSIKLELDLYFKNKLHKFTTPIKLIGTPFQISVWEQLRDIPSGQVRSYSSLAQSIGKPSAFRAVANANGRNKLAIVVPCHRVINLDGKIGGYAGGISCKQWLIKNEIK